VFVLVQDRCTVYVKRTMAQKSFFTHLMVLLVTRIKWKLDSICLEIVLVLTRDRCTVCDEHTIGS
jgi:hypothetical protein